MAQNPNKTYILFTKLASPAFQTIRISASGFTVFGEPKQIQFTDNGNQVAVFNVSELVGFAQEDHIIN